MYSTGFSLLATPDPPSRRLFSKQDTVGFGSYCGRLTWSKLKHLPDVSKGIRIPVEKVRRLSFAQQIDVMRSNRKYPSAGKL
jgi:hypothetical protein